MLSEWKSNSPFGESNRRHTTEVSDPPKAAPGNDLWYRRNALFANESSQLSALLSRLESLFVNTNLTADCAFSFLFQGWASAELCSHGVAGCAMGERFVTVKWNGDVYPCSHLHGEEFKAENVRESTFTEIWEMEQAANWLVEPYRSSQRIDYR